MHHLELILSLYELSTGEVKILLIEVNIVDISPTDFQFNVLCVTTGAPIPTANWTLNNTLITKNNESFAASFIVTDYITSTYNHTLVVTENLPGKYGFHAENPFSEEEPLVVTKEVKGKANACCEC